MSPFEQKYWDTIVVGRNLFEIRAGGRANDQIDSILSSMALGKPITKESSDKLHFTHTITFK
jgi:hypothetical protein